MKYSPGRHLWHIPKFMHLSACRVTVCCALLLYIAMPLYSQPVRISGFTHYGSTNPGISSNTVIKTYEDHRGLMWFCTTNGADLFNGKNIQSFRFSAQDTSSMPAPVVAAMQQDDHGRYWFACIGGLGIYDPYSARERQWTRLYKSTETKKGLPGDQIQFLQYDGHGHMWASTLATGLMKIHVETFDAEVVDLNVPEDRPVKDAPGIYYSPADTTLYVAANENRLISIHVKTGAFRAYGHVIDSILMTTGPHDAPVDFRVTNVFRGGDGTLWMTARGNDLIAWNPAAAYSQVWRFGPSRQDSDRIFPVAEDADGHIWFSFPHKGLFIMDRTTGAINNYLNDPVDPLSLVNNTIHHILKDRNGAMWLSTYRGVNKFDPWEHPFTYTRPYLGRDLRDAPYIRCYTQDAEGNEWLGTERGVILYSAGSTGSTVFEEIPLTVDDQLSLAVHSLIVLSDSTMLLGSGRGLYTFNIRKRQVDPYVWRGCADCPPPPGSSVNALLPDTIDGIPHVWVGGFRAGYGLFLLNLQDSVLLSVQAVADSTGWIPDDLIWDIEKDQEGYVWIAARNGLRRIDSMNPWAFGKPSSSGSGTFGLYDLEVKDICFDKLNQLYAITSRGLILRSHDRYINGVEMFPGTNVIAHNVFTDANGYAWIVTASEYIRFHPVENTFALYDARVGSRGNFGISHFYQRRDGSLVYQSYRQINILDPDYVKADLPSPHTYISDFHLFDTTRLDLFGHEHLHLHYTENSITFFFASSSYTFSDLNLYRWELSGVDRGWTTIPGRNYAQYSALPHGHYTFRVQSRNAAGIWDEEGATYRFTIVPPWYLSMWFKILVAFAGIGLVWYVVRQRTQRLLALQRIEIEKSIALEQERSRISRDMHDDLGSSLSAIHLLSGYMKEHAEAKYPEFSSDMEKIRQTSEELNQRLREIIWAMNTKDDNLRSLVLFIERYVHELNENTNTRIRVHVPDPIPDITLSGAQRKNIFLSFKEALNNALKHGKPTAIEIDISTGADNVVSVLIQDNGTGFSDTRQVHEMTGNGLANIRDRMEEIRGTAEIDSNATGTKVRLSVFV